MTMTLDVLEQTIDQVHEFSKKNWGMKCGPDFTEVVRVLATSEKFETYAMVAGMIAMLSGMGIKDLKDKYPEGDPRFAEEAKEQIASPVKETLAEVFYVGYLLGKREAEVTALEKFNATITTNTKEK